MERKSEWFCGVNFFRSNFKVECENGVWTKIRFLGSGFLFTCGNFTLIFYCFFFRFLDRIFSKWFSQSIHSSFTASFSFELNFLFSLVVLLFTCGILTLFFFVFFSYFLIWFFKNRFLNSLLVHSRSSFLLSQWKFFELYVRTCPAMFFTSSNFFSLYHFAAFSTFCVKSFWLL